jgi:hypothetical protein
MASAGTNFLATPAQLYAILRASNNGLSIRPYFKDFMRAEAVAC